METHLVVSDPAKRTIVEETDWAVKDVEALATHRYDNKDIGAAIASGSFKTDGMVIVPCSVKAAASVAHCLADNLLTRAADVTLKEGRPLILVVRETPLHLGHLRVLTALAEMGAVILPPMPAFYNRPKQIEDLVDHTLGARPRQARPAPAAGDGVAGHQPAHRPAAARVSGIASDGARVPAAALDLSIVVPVYNEEENLPLLWPEIREVLASDEAQLRGDLRR